MTKTQLRFAFAILIMAAFSLGGSPITALAHNEFEIRVTVPASVTPPNAFTVTVQVTKPFPYDPLATFRRIAIAYAPNDNLTFVGPIEVWQGTPTWSGTPPTATVNVNLQLLTSRPTGSIIPLVVTLWDNSYQADQYRGGTAAGVKIIK